MISGLVHSMSNIHIFKMLVLYIKHNGCTIEFICFIREEMRSRGQNVMMELRSSLCQVSNSHWARNMKIHLHLSLF